MKKLGLVGGMGPESTIPYYHGILYGVQHRTGRQGFPPLTVESVDVYTVLSLCGQQNYDELTDYLLAALQNLAAAGADFAALSANTPHIVFDRLQARSPLPLVSIVECARAEAKRRGYRRLGLLGTLFTMTGDFFKAPFVQSGIEILTPTGQEMAFVQQKIAGELELGVVLPETQRAILQIIRRMQRQDGIEAVILGCTELPLLLNDAVCPLPCLDTMQIHVNTLVEQILADPPHRPNETE